MTTFTSVASMLLQSRNAGEMVSTQGYYAPLASISAPKGGGTYNSYLNNTNDIIDNGTGTVII